MIIRPARRNSTVSDESGKKRKESSWPLLSCNRHLTREMGSRPTLMIGFGEIASPAKEWPSYSVGETDDHLLCCVFCVYSIYILYRIYINATVSIYTYGFTGWASISLLVVSTSPNSGLYYYPTRFPFISRSPRLMDHQTGENVSFLHVYAFWYVVFFSFSSSLCLSLTHFFL